MTIANDLPTSSSNLPSLRIVVTRGAAWGATACMLYATLFALYAMARASSFVWNAQPPQLRATFAVFDVTLLYLSLVFAILLLLVAAPLGAVTALVIRLVTTRLRKPWAAALTGAAVALLICAAIAGYVPTLFGDRMSPTAYPQTFWFWLGLPALVYVLAAALGARRLAQYRQNVGVP
jgi:hypothetical protein